jgi:uncharacterized cupin superfamily protein
VRKFNLQGKLDYDASDPEGYRAGMGRFGKSIGAKQLGGSVYELPTGQSICPYHYEYGNEEWLIVLEGRPTLRHPDGEEELEPGDVVPFLEGPKGAHKVTNRTAKTARVLMVSTNREPSVAVYPDSGKIGVWPGSRRDTFMIKRGRSVGYYEGETKSS